MRGLVNRRCLKVGLFSDAVGASDALSPASSPVVGTSISEVCRGSGLISMLSCSVNSPAGLCWYAGEHIRARTETGYYNVG